MHKHEVGDEVAVLVRTFFSAGVDDFDEWGDRWVRITSSTGVDYWTYVDRIRELGPNELVVLRAVEEARNYDDSWAPGSHVIWEEVVE